MYSSSFGFNYNIFQMYSNLIIHRYVLIFYLNQIMFLHHQIIEAFLPSMSRIFHFRNFLTFTTSNRMFYFPICLFFSFELKTTSLCSSDSIDSWLSFLHVANLGSIPGIVSGKCQEWILSVKPGVSPEKHQTWPAMHMFILYLAFSMIFHYQNELEEQKV